MYMFMHFSWLICKMTNAAYSRQKPGVGQIQDTEVAKKEINIKD